MVFPGIFSENGKLPYNIPVWARICIANGIGLILGILMGPFIINPKKDKTH